MTTIVTDRLELRPLVPEDADEMASVLGDERLHDFTGGRPLPPEQLRARYEHLAGGWSPDGTEQWCNWIVRVGPGGDAVGFAQATVGGDGVTALTFRGRIPASDAAVVTAVKRPGWSAVGGNLADSAPAVLRVAASLTACSCSRTS